MRFAPTFRCLSILCALHPRPDVRPAARSHVGPAAHDAWSVSVYPLPDALGPARHAERDIWPLIWDPVHRILISVTAALQATRRMRNEFMSCWDGLRTASEQRVMVMGATNRPWDLDDAVIRRMPRRIMVPLPDAANREKILKARARETLVQPLLAPPAARIRPLPCSS
jgi:SpoVK/Ycf46/Vps4 family AAA+-type ATPase